jgi:hypothetical protein
MECNPPDMGTGMGWVGLGWVKKDFITGFQIGLPVKFVNTYIGIFVYVCVNNSS